MRGPGLWGVELSARAVSGGLRCLQSAEPGGPQVEPGSWDPEVGRSRGAELLPVRGVCSGPREPVASSRALGLQVGRPEAAVPSAFRVLPGSAQVGSAGQGA